MGGDTRIEEMSQKNRNVLYLVCLTSRGEKVMLSVLGSIAWSIHTVCSCTSWFFHTGKVQCPHVPTAPAFIFIQQLSIYTLTAYLHVCSPLDGHSLRTGSIISSCIPQHFWAMILCSINVLLNNFFFFFFAEEDSPWANICANLPLFAWGRLSLS